MEPHPVDTDIHAAGNGIAAFDGSQWREEASPGPLYTPLPVTP